MLARGTAVSDDDGWRRGNSVREARQQSTSSLCSSRESRRNHQDVEHNRRYESLCEQPTMKQFGHLFLPQTPSIFIVASYIGEKVRREKPLDFSG
jgi:hypothetical protein